MEGVVHIWIHIFERRKGTRFVNFWWKIGELNYWCEIIELLPLNNGQNLCYLDLNNQKKFEQKLNKNVHRNSYVTHFMNRSLIKKAFHLFRQKQHRKITHKNSNFFFSLISDLAQHVTLHLINRVISIFFNQKISMLPNQPN